MNITMESVQVVFDNLKTKLLTHDEKIKKQAYRKYMTQTTADLPTRHLSPLQTKHDPLEKIEIKPKPDPIEKISNISLNLVSELKKPTFKSQTWLVDDVHLLHLHELKVKKKTSKVLKKLLQRETNLRDVILDTS